MWEDGDDRWEDASKPLVEFLRQRRTVREVLLGGSKATHRSRYWVRCCLAWLDMRSIVIYDEKTKTWSVREEQKYATRGKEHQKPRV